MENDDFKQQVQDFFAKHKPEVVVDRRKLDSALYTVCQMNLLEEGIDSISVEVALQLHAIVETVRTQGYPDELRV